MVEALLARGAKLKVNMSLTEYMCRRHIMALRMSVVSTLVLTSSLLCQAACAAQDYCQGRSNRGRVQMQHMQGTSSTLNLLSVGTGTGTFHGLTAFVASRSAALEDVHIQQNQTTSVQPHLSLCGRYLNLCSCARTPARVPP